MRHARLLLLGAHFALLSACVWIVVPNHKDQTVTVKIERGVVQTPRDEGVSVGTLPDNPAPAADGGGNAAVSHALIKAPDGKTTCGVYAPPKHDNPPGTPEFTFEEKNDVYKLNARLTGFIGELRDYILKGYQLDNDAYTQYQKSCVNNAPTP